MNPHLLLLINNCWRQIANEIGDCTSPLYLDAVQHIEETEKLLRKHVPTDGAGCEILYAEVAPRRRRA